MSSRRTVRNRPGTVNVSKATDAYAKTAGKRPADGVAASNWDKGLMASCPRIRQVVSEGVCAISSEGKVVPRGQGRM